MDTLYHNTIEKQYRYEKKPFVITNTINTDAVFQKKLLAKIKFDRKIYHDLLMFYYSGGLCHYVQRLWILSVNPNIFLKLKQKSNFIAHNLGHISLKNLREVPLPDQLTHAGIVL